MKQSIERRFALDLGRELDMEQERIMVDDPWTKKKVDELFGDTRTLLSKHLSREPDGRIRVGEIPHPSGENNHGWLTIVFDERMCLDIHTVGDHVDVVAWRAFGTPAGNKVVARK